MGVELIPLHVWNKQIKGDDRGKTPLHAEWNTKEYGQNNANYKKWIDSGYNVGYRIADNELVVDLDPRNYVEGIDSEELIADLFGFFDFEELTWELPVVRTGSGGYHIYCLLPDDVDYKLIRKCVENIPGVDFKKKGGYVVTAGSKHPNGEYYEWENQAERQEAPSDLLELIKRNKFEKKDFTSGYGAFTGTQLQDLVLDKLDVNDFDSNDTWEPLMMECHHATAGDGIEEFLAWSLSDTNYSGDENKIRNRWESLDDTKDVTRTAASLIHRLKQQGEDTSGAKAVLDFGSKSDFDLEEEDDGEDEILKSSKRAASEVEVSDIIDVPKDKGGIEGAALEAARDISPSADASEKMKVIRLIKVASVEESIEAQELLVERGVMKMAAINKRLKSLDQKMKDSVGEVLSNLTRKSVFKEGKHITVEPNKQIWIFNKTHWVPISDNYLGKVVLSVLDTLKDKMEIDAKEVTLMTDAVKTIMARESTPLSKLFRTEKYDAIINCKNGEVHINEDGSHSLKPHNYKSYQLRCLKANYDPSAECPMFIQTLEEIFANFPDTDEMIRHIAEVMGYIIQPYKPDANWWMFRGPGGDGKSTIIKVLNGILGDALYSADEALLGTGSGHGNSHITTDLVGKLAVVIEELKAGKALNDSGLKMLAENTKMTANPKNKDTFSFNYIGSLIMCCNHFPVIKDTSEGTVRRANVIPFNRQFVKMGTADNNRARKILQDENELAGVLNFMLEGYKRYAERGKFLPPESCLLAKEEWLCEANNVVRFVKENVRILGDKTVRMCSASEVHNRYDRWCNANGITPKNRNNLYKDLVNVGLSKKEAGGNRLWFYGGELLEEVFDDFDEMEEDF